MSNRRKRKQARKQARREERKTRLVELESRRLQEEDAGLEMSTERVSPVLVDEWDDFDPEYEERIRKDRAIKDRRARKQELLNEALSR